MLNDRPVNAETPAHQLDDAITPTDRHFIRNNELPPEAIDAASWRLTVDGFVRQPLELSIDDLRQRFEVVTRALVLECAGNGSAFFDPPASGSQWPYGAVACAQWTGVRLKEILQAAGIREEAVYTAHYGAVAPTRTFPARRTTCRSPAACGSRKRWTRMCLSPFR